MNDSNGCIFKGKNVLKGKDIYTFYVCIYMYKVIKYEWLSYTSEHMDLQTRNHTH